ELVALAPDVILASGSVSTGALFEATSTVPIVFAHVPDPVGAGFVESLTRPGGNVTGFSPFEYAMSGKWLELLKEIAPRVAWVGVLRDRAARGVGGGTSRSRHCCRDRPVRRDRGGRGVVWGRVEPDGRARRR